MRATSNTHFAVCSIESRREESSSRTAASPSIVGLSKRRRIGVATPKQVRGLIENSVARGFHGHNTRNTGFANAYAALEGGATTLDSSIGGLGGCPFAPKATGNIATEDLVYMLEGDGVETGVDLDALIEISQWLEELLGRRLEGQVYRAGPSPASA